MVLLCPVLVFPVPGPSTNFTSTDVTNVSISVTWESPDFVPDNQNISLYELQFNGTTNIVDVGNRTFTANGLQPFTNYSFRVVARTSVSEGFEACLVIQTDESGLSAQANLCLCACVCVCVRPCV